MVLDRLRLLLLTAFLLLGQLGGVFHGLSHQDESKERPHAACQLCAAYSVFDHAAAGKLPMAVAGQAFTPARPVAQSNGDQPSQLPYRSRAPPYLG